MSDEYNDPLWRQGISGAQMLFVAFGALVLMPLITGMDPNVALFTAGIGTLLFQLVTGRQVPALPLSRRFSPPKASSVYRPYSVASSPPAWCISCSAPWCGSGAQVLSTACCHPW